MATETAEPPAVKEAATSTFATPMNAPEPQGDDNDFAKKFNLGSAFKPDATKPLHKAKVEPAKAKEPEATEEGSQTQDAAKTQQTEENPVAAILEQKKDTPAKKLNFVEGLKHENEELKKKVEQFEKDSVPTLTQKISDLEKQINDSDSKKETEKLQRDLQSAQEILDNRSKENEQLKQRLSILDLPNDPDFKAKFEAPMNQSYQLASSIIGSDNAQQAELQKAFHAISASLRATNPEEAQRQREFAIETVNAIHESLSPIQQGQFGPTFWDLAAKATNYVNAIKNHEQTTKSIMEERYTIQQEQRLKTKQRWGGAIKTAQEQLAPVMAYSDEIARIITSNKFDDNIGVDEAIAQAAIDDEAQQFPPEDIARVLIQGTAHKKLVAKVAALEKLAAEKDETISKLQGSQTGGGASQGNSNGDRKVEVEKTPESFHDSIRQRIPGWR